MVNLEPRRDPEDPFKCSVPWWIILRMGIYCRHIALCGRFDATAPGRRCSTHRLFKPVSLHPAVPVGTFFGVLRPALRSGRVVDLPIRSVDHERSSRHHRLPVEAAGVHFSVVGNLRRPECHVRLRTARRGVEAERQREVVALDGVPARRHRGGSSTTRRRATGTGPTSSSRTTSAA